MVRFPVVKRLQLIVLPGRLILWTVPVEPSTSEPATVRVHPLPKTVLYKYILAVVLAVVCIVLLSMFKKLLAVLAEGKERQVTLLFCRYKVSLVKVNEPPKFIVLPLISITPAVIVKPAVASALGEVILIPFIEALPLPKVDKVFVVICMIQLSMFKVFVALAATAKALQVILLFCIFKSWSKVVAAKVKDPPAVMVILLAVVMLFKSIVPAVVVLVVKVQLSKL